MFPISKRLIQS